ncbi:glycosyltransferase [Flavobacteriaceae bacterium]|nr:glycosyltransferase [Flavobacteriaceae bacterium]
MRLGLVICTYNRDLAVKELLESISCQTDKPDFILIVDASTNFRTNDIVVSNRDCLYIKVNEENRGLTKQRNIGIKEMNRLNVDLISFLDDDIILDKDYFKVIKSSFSNEKIIGVGGYIMNEGSWEKVSSNVSGNYATFIKDGYSRSLGSRYILRRLLGLFDLDQPIGFVPLEGNGTSVGFFPPSGKVYPTELVMGGVSTFRTRIFDKIKFSTYFEGYGLYEDAEFSIRATRLGKLVINTNAQVNHYHAPSGRPNKYSYGKMVIRNGWFVWRTKNRNPKFIHRLKWNLTVIVLMNLRLVNVLTKPNKFSSFSEYVGRLVGYFSLLFNKPNIEKY